MILSNDIYKFSVHSFVPFGITVNRDFRSFKSLQILSVFEFPKCQLQTSKVRKFQHQHIM
jgi:hypothetical protein